MNMNDFEEVVQYLFTKFAARELQDINVGIDALHRRLDEIENYLLKKPYAFYKRPDHVPED